ncbi:MAG: hypothetical protein K2Q26_04320 [Bdellovibrionales bacterium]|nr:hypothetical protein [Bdellovibrionales bacterium]
MGKFDSNNKFYIVAFCLLMGGAFAFMGADKTKTQSQRYAMDYDDDGLEVAYRSGGDRGRRFREAKPNLPTSPKVNYEYISSPTAYQHANAFVSEDTSHLSQVAKVTLEKDKKKKVRISKARLSLAKAKESARKKKMSDSLSNSSMINGGGTGLAAANPQQAQQEKEKEEENLDTVDFWVDPIFRKVEYEAVMKLIDSYQIKKVSPSVFYTVVDDMSHDERDQLREYGLLALSSTPSARSFSQLTWIKHNDTDATLRTTANNEVANYTDASRLNYIVTALKATSSGSPRTTIEALRVVRAATEKYARGITQQTTQPTPVKSNSASAISKIANAAEVITTTHLKSSDATVKAEAQQTMNTVNRYINL